MTDRRSLSNRNWLIVRRITWGFVLTYMTAYVAWIVAWLILDITGRI